MLALPNKATAAEIWLGVGSGVDRGGAQNALIFNSQLRVWRADIYYLIPVIPNTQ